VEDGPGGSSDDEGRHSPEVKGAASAINATSGTFVLTPRKTKGFVLGQATMTIITNASTVYRTDGGRTTTKENFFALLSSTLYAEAEGTYDAATNTLTAKKVKIEDESESHGDRDWEGGSHHDRDDHDRDGDVDDDDKRHGDDDRDDRDDD
jgi:hypothetical protein